MNKFKLILLFTALEMMIFSGCTTSASGAGGASSIQSTQSESDVVNQSSPRGAVAESLPLDPEVRTGFLDNGLTWYIRENSKPEGRAFLRLIIKAGSILEDDDQLGIAHLVEHMAFNGTENFEKMELVDYLESIGMAFGPEVNAYTSFDETVYMLEVPTDDEEILSNGFLILEDWAHRLTMDDEEIELERGVVLEEWRLSRGASGRIRDQVIPVLLGGSRYAERLPIGEMDVVMNTPAERIRDFYRDWYRPDLMAIVAVGDFDIDEIQSRIENQFSGIPTGSTRGRSEYNVPINTEPAVKIITDPEVQTGNFEFSIKTGPLSFRSRDDYRNYLIRSIFWGIFNTRLDELARSGEPPFIGAQGGASRFIVSRSFITYTGMVSPGSAGRGIESIIHEVRRMIEYGILPEELEREKAGHMTSIESAWQDRNNRKSPSLAQEITAFYLNDIFMPGIEVEYGFFMEMIPDITKEDVDSYAETILPDIGRSLTLVVPESALSSVSESFSGEQGLLAIVEEAEKRQPDPPAEDELPDKLMDRPKGNGRIVSSEESEDTGAVSWTLDNGVKIVYKKTDFMEDEVLFQAFSPGGLSLHGDEEYHMGLYASLFRRVSGLGDYSATDLEKILAGRNVELSSYIGEYFEGFQGKAAPGDLEVLFQLIRMHFVDPGYTPDSFENVRTRLVPLLENRLKDPRTLYEDRLRELINSGAYRSKPLNLDILREMNLEGIENVYRSRFNFTGDFTFLFVGNIDSEELKTLSVAYLSDIPPGSAGEPGEAEHIRENWVDLGIRPPEGTVEEDVVIGVEPKGRVTFYFHGEGAFTREERVVVAALGSMLQTKLREVIREDLSGTYSIGVNSSSTIYPYEGWSVIIGFGCDPGRADELSMKVMGVIGEIKTDGMDDEYIRKEIEKYRRAYETGIEENGFWLAALEESIKDRGKIEPPLTPEEYEDTLRSVSVRDLTLRLFTDNYIRLVLLPSEDVF